MRTALATLLLVTAVLAVIAAACWLCNELPPPGPGPATTEGR